MRLKKLIALLSSVTMLGAMSAAVPLTASAAETILLNQPMDSEEAVQAVIDGGKYEAMVAENNGTEANIELSYVNAGEQYPCLNMKDKNEWYTSAGLKYDITDLVAGKQGALTITADLSAGYNAVSNAKIGFISDGGEKVSCENTAIASGDFAMVTYTAESIPEHDGKLYFFASTENPTLRIRNLKLTLTTEDAGAKLPIVDNTFSAGSIPGYYTTTGTAGLSADGTWLSASNVKVNNSDNIDANSEFITINIGEAQLAAGDTVNVGFTYTNRNGSTKSAAVVELACGDKTISVGETAPIAGNGGTTTENFSKDVTVPQDYEGGAIKLVLKVSASTGAPKIKDVNISKVQKHSESFTFAASLEALANKTLKITAQKADGSTATSETPYNNLTITTASGNGEAVLGLIIEDIPEGITITKVVFE